MKKTRRERRLEARENGVEFIPQYNGKSPQTHEEFYGVGYERFNSKFVTIKTKKEVDNNEDY